MKNSIHYTSEHPTKFNELLALYESLGWNSLKLTVNELELSTTIQISPISTK